MRILFIHNNFPGQYHRILNRLKGDKDYQLAAATLSSNKQPIPIPAVGYKLHREPANTTHPAVRYTEKAVINGQAAARAFLTLKQRGFNPDIVLSHSGWGPSLFIKDVWPDTRHLSYFEWYYRSEGGDVGFLERAPQTDINERIKTRMKSTAFLHDLAAMDWGQCPTNFQLSQIPDIFRDRITVLHDGVDTEFFSPAEDASFTIGKHVFRKGDPLVTYIARGMEPYRGFPQFIEAISRLQKVNPHVHAVVIGEDRVAYGKPRTDGKSWKEWALAEFQPDMDRLHFLGHRPLGVLRDVLRVSAAHVYFTVPFVLSWSMIEAMSAGALIVGSDTPAVAEVVTDGHNGLLSDFFDVQALADRLGEVVADPRRFDSLRAAARQTALDRYEVGEMTDRYLSLIHRVAAGQRPEPDAR